MNKWITAALVFCAAFAGAHDFVTSRQEAQLTDVSKQSEDLAERLWREKIKTLVTEALAKRPYLTTIQGDPVYLHSMPHPRGNGEKYFIHTWELQAVGKHCQFASEGWDFNGRYDGRVGKVWILWCM